MKNNNNRYNEYRNINWKGYTMTHYEIAKQFIDMYGPGIFTYFDKDRSGGLDMNEVPNMVYHLFRYLKLPKPNIMDIYYTMYVNDRNKDGIISYKEFVHMMYYMAGISY